MRTLAKDGYLSAEDVFRIVRSTMAMGGAFTGLPGKFTADATKGVIDMAMGDFEKGATEMLGWSPYKAEELSKK